MMDGIPVVTDHFVAIFSAFISFLGLLLVVIQIRAGTKQRNLEALYQIYDVNRELLSLGFSHPQLFSILADVEIFDPEQERRYLQLWLNQLSLIQLHLRHGNFDAEFHESLKRDIRFIMSLTNMQRHWSRFHEFYPASFQRLVNQALLTIQQTPKATNGS